MEANNPILLGEEYSQVFREDIIHPFDTHVLSILGQYGPLTIKEIQDKLAIAKTNNDFFAYPNFEIKNFDPKIRASLVKLAKKEFVVPISKTRKLTEKKLSGQRWFLKFPGLIWYFRHSGKNESEQYRLRLFIQKYHSFFKGKQKPISQLIIPRAYTTLFPFCPLWNEMDNLVGESLFYEELQKTIDNFFVVYIYPHEIENITIESYAFNKFESKHYNAGSKNSKFAYYIRDNKNPMLRESYICHLIRSDIQDLSIESRKSTDFSKLRFINESRDLGVPCANHKEVLDFLKKIFPKYNTIPNLFTGVFVNNLLWSK